MKGIIRRIINKFGYDITEIPKFDGSYDPHSTISKQHRDIVDLDALANISLSIPGMITTEAGKLLYSLCYMQEAGGDVVEIGSWQGRSTSFLGRAVSNSGNGKFYAIDHFKGNVGKEHFYKVGKDDLTDLKGNFMSNMERVGVADSVTLLDMPNEQAEKDVGDIKVRFLFIDGDHTREGVEKDIGLFFPKLIPGSIVVFDDFSKHFSGLVDAVDAVIAKQNFSRVMSYHNTLVLIV